MYTIEIQTSVHSGNTVTIVIADVKQLVDLLFILEGSERVKAFKIHQAGVTISDLYKTFGWGKFNKHTTKFVYN